MQISEIPLSPDNQRFTITLNGTALQMAVTWRELFWCLDISDAAGAPLITGLPLVTGADLLAQYRHLRLGISLYISLDNPANENPTKTDLGINSHLYAITE